VVPSSWCSNITEQCEVLLLWATLATDQTDPGRFPVAVILSRVVASLCEISASLRRNSIQW